MLKNANQTPIDYFTPAGKWKKADLEVGLSEPGLGRLRINEVTFSTDRKWFSYHTLLVRMDHSAKNVHPGITARAKSQI
jgi:hypothetical protein